MSRIKVLAFESNGVPKMLSDDAEIAQAIANGDVVRDTSVTLYLDDGERRFGPAGTHPELQPWFPEPVTARELPDTGFAEATPLTPGEQPVRATVAREATGATVNLGMSAVDRRADLPVRSPPVEIDFLGLGGTPSSSPTPARGASADADSIWAFMFLPYVRYAQFEGRSRRKEFWSFLLFTVVVSFILAVSASAKPSDGGVVILFLFLLGSLVPTLAVQVRRFHDLGTSGWAALIGLVPYVGTVAILLSMLVEGQRGANKYGEDPKGPTGQRRLG